MNAFDHQIDFRVIDIHTHAQFCNIQSFGGQLAAKVRLEDLEKTNRAKMIGTPDILVVDTNTPNFCLICKGEQGDECSCTCVSRDENRNSSRTIGVCPAPCKTSLKLSTAKLLIVEGNIGVGKTTLARKLATELNYKLFLEPTTENPFLGL